jgi:hypothetical protein
MRTGGKKADDGGVRVTPHRNKAMTRSICMEQVMMKNIMRLVVAGSVVAIAVNLIMLLG